MMVSRSTVHELGGMSQGWSRRNLTSIEALQSEEESMLPSFAQVRSWMTLARLGSFHQRLGNRLGRVPVKRLAGLCDVDLERIEQLLSHAWLAE